MTYIFTFNEKNGVLEAGHPLKRKKREIGQLPKDNYLSTIHDQIEEHFEKRGIRGKYQIQTPFGKKIGSGHLEI